MRFAIVREISPRLSECELTHMDREPIDVDRARAQHAEYVQTLRDLGCHVIELPASEEHPDCVFVEDTVVVLDDVAIMTRPGAESRRGEGEAIEAVLAPYRRIERIVAPGTLDGGDVIVSGKRILVGRSTRTNDAGIEQLAALAAPSGYEVTPVDVTGCLHLKTAGTLVAEDTLLINRGWADFASFNGFKTIDVDPGEPFAGCALLIDDQVLVPKAFTATQARLEEAGLSVRGVPNSELAKCEGGVTCCSVIFDADWKPRLVD